MNMRNLKLVLEYDGNNFYGWEYQPDRRTVQGELEMAVRRITGEDIRITGAGRTDHGVHALAQVANFKTRSDIPCEKLKEGLNALTGEDIYIKEVSEAPFDFHARFSARSKIYQYRIMTRFSPLKRMYYWFVNYKLNLQSMSQSAESFIGEHDFRYISVSNGDEPQEYKRNTICTMYHLSLTEVDNDIIINLEANRFLRKMVRGIVGFLVDVGRGRFQPETTEKLFTNRCRGLYFAPAQGLYLVEVKY